MVVSPMTTLVTGGTGSFGHAYVKAHPGERIRILSRDEEKQRAMRVEFPDLEYAIGDVRDRDAVRAAMRGCDKVFHAAALKQVPQCEDHPGEAYRTNVTGTENVCLVAQEQGARVVLLSTDKAVLPVGVMGATKMLAEAVATHYGFNVVRYGNVIGSRGSILPVFRDQMARGVPITITDPHMTRFLITLDEAIELVDVAMGWIEGGYIFVRKSPASTVEQFVRVLAPDYPTTVIGTRPGEKRHEDLLAPHERVAEEFDKFFIVERNKPGGATYTSEHAPRLSDEALAALL
jgi:UDP-N-acetylglucosamine 4,6-dehydratase/5-epimerase